MFFMKNEFVHEITSQPPAKANAPQGPYDPAPPAKANAPQDPQIAAGGGGQDRLQQMLHQAQGHMAQAQQLRQQAQGLLAQALQEDQQARTILSIAEGLT